MLTHLITNIQSRILLSALVMRLYQFRGLDFSMTYADPGQGMVARREERFWVI